jgi:hypothetical protein
MNTIKRSSTWLTHELDAYLRDAATKPFAWGTTDCCLFAADAVLAMTGVDIADDFRGKYGTQAEALALIKTVTGGTTVTDAIVHCATKFGLMEWLKADGSPCPLMAKRGDLCAVLNDGNIIAGVIELSGRYVACQGDAGLIRLQLSAIQRAWHVSVS